MQKSTILGFDSSLVGNTQVYNLFVDGIGNYSIMCGRYLKAHMKEMKSLVKSGYISDRKVVVA